MGNAEDADEEIGKTGCGNKQCSWGWGWGVEKGKCVPVSHRFLLFIIFPASLNVSHTTVSMFAV